MGRFEIVLVGLGGGLGEWLFVDGFSEWFGVCLLVDLGGFEGGVLGGSRWI